MTFGEVQSGPEHSEQERLVECETAKQKCSTERAELNNTVQTDVIFNGLEGIEHTEAKAALEFAYAQMYLTPSDQPRYQREIVTGIQDLLLVYGELTAIPPEDIQPLLKHEAIRQAGDNQDQENLEQKATNQSLISIREQFPDLKGTALVEAMLGKLNPEAEGYAAQLNTLLTIKLLFASKATAPRVQEALDSGTAFEPATLRTIAVDFLSAGDVTEQQKTEVRRRLGIVDTGSQLDDVLDHPKEDGSGQPFYGEDNPLQVRNNMQAYAKPDGEKMIVIDIPDDLGNSRKLYRSFESMRGEEIGEYANVVSAG